MIEEEHVTMPLSQDGDANWQAWLASHTAFAFQGRNGTANLLKEARTNRGEGYWYAYRRQGRRTVKRYVGRSAELTVAQLEAVAAKLASSPVPSQSLLLPKLRLPQLHASLIPRQRLSEQLDAALTARLTLITAPAGSGKTTLVRQWIASRSLPPLGWVALDSGDNDPIRFWRYVFTACGAFGADLSRTALTLLDMMPQPPYATQPLDIAITAFLNALAGGSPEGPMPHEGILVLEDYHVIVEPRIHETVTFLLEHLPASIHLIVLSRGEPPLPLARLRARNDLCELRAADLRFSLSETDAFLRLAIPLLPNIEIANHLHARLEGWAAGLRMATLAMQRGMQPDSITAYLSAFAGNQQPVLDYFVTEVLAAQPESLQRFLLLTGSLQRLTGSLCAAVTGMDESADILEELERRHVFVERLAGRSDADGPEQWYRYHALFAEALEHEAQRRLGADVLRDAARRASQWYARHSLTVEAVEAALAGQDIEHAIAIIKQNAQTRKFVEFHTLRHWLDRLPIELIHQDATLCLIYATAQIMSGMQDSIIHSQAVRAQIDALLQLAEDSWRRAGNDAGVGCVYATRAVFLGYHGGDYRASMRWGQEALALLPAEEQMMRSLAQGHVAIGAMMNGQVDLAQQMLTAARENLAVAEHNGFSRALTGMRAWLCYGQGRLHQAAEYFQRMLVEAHRQGDLSDIGPAMSGLAQLAYEWNDLQAAREQVQTALNLYQHPADIFDTRVMTQLTLLSIRIQRAQGHIVPAQQQLAELLTRLQPEGVPAQRHLYREGCCTQAALQLATGDIDAAQRWAESRVQDDTLPLIHHLQEAILEARLLIAQNRTADALAHLTRLLATTQQAGYKHDALLVQLLMAVAHASCRQMAEAQALLKTVLEQARTEGYTRLFLDEGDSVASLLAALAPHIHDRSLKAYLHAILNAFTAARTGRPHLAQAGGLIEPLSAQELRVLRLLVAGRTNQEIAGELIVSVNTIRTHVQRIFRKLNVHNRVGASEVARRHHLCEQENHYNG